MLHYDFIKKIRGEGTSFQSSEVNQKHVENVPQIHYLTKSHFDFAKDSKEIIKSVTFIIQQCLW